MQKLLPLAIACLGVLFAQGGAAVHHPVMSRILQDFAQPQRGECGVQLSDYYQTIASVETSEVAFATLDRADGYCEVVALGEGGEAFVSLDIKRLEELLDKGNVRYLQNVHTHVTNNVSYFSEGGPEYQGEIMFSSWEHIKKRRVSQSQFIWLTAAASRGEIPGHNLSPPSIVDLKFLLDRRLNQKAKSDQYDSVVVTSGGVWFYRAEDAGRIASARQVIDSLVSYATIFERAAEPGPMRERLQALVKLHQEDPEIGPMIRLWQMASLELRAPYSPAAIEAARRGDNQQVLSEYADKLAWAEKLAQFLTDIGIATRFQKVPGPQW